MLCDSCNSAVIVRVNSGDLNYKGESVLRQIVYCALIAKEMKGLIECTRYEKNVPNNKT